MSHFQLASEVNPFSYLVALIKTRSNLSTSFLKDEAMN